MDNRRRSEKTKLPSQCHTITPRPQPFQAAKQLPGHHDHKPLHSANRSFTTPTLNHFRHSTILKPQHHFTIPVHNLCTLPTSDNTPPSHCYHRPRVRKEAESAVPFLVLSANIEARVKAERNREQAPPILHLHFTPLHDCDTTSSTDNHNLNHCRVRES